MRNLDVTRLNMELTKRKRYDIIHVENEGRKEMNWTFILGVAVGCAVAIIIRFLKGEKE